MESRSTRYREVGAYSLLHPDVGLFGVPLSASLLAVFVRENSDFQPHPYKNDWPEEQKLLSTWLVGVEVIDDCRADGANQQVHAGEGESRDDHKGDHGNLCSVVGAL